MPQLNDLSRSPVALDQDSTIIAVVEMSQSSWLVAGVLPEIERQPRKKLEPSAERLLGLLHRWRDEAVRAGKKITRIALAFEAGQLTERGHFLGLDQIGLGGFQIAIGGFGSVPSGVDLGLTALALGDVAIDQDEATTRHRIAADLDDPAIWSCPCPSAIPGRFHRGNYHAFRRRERVEVSSQGSWKRRTRMTFRASYAGSLQPTMSARHRAPDTPQRESRPSVPRTTGPRTRSRSSRRGNRRPARRSRRLVYSMALRSTHRHRNSHRAMR